MAHFHSRSIIDEANKQQEIWKNLFNRDLNGEILLPHPYIKVYDENGNYICQIERNMWDDPDYQGNENDLIKVDPI